LNFNITYNEDEEKPYNLEQLRGQNSAEVDFLPTDIFQGEPSPEDIQKYKDSLYYFRGFMGSDGRYNVEGQIRCNTDSTSRYGCAILNEIPETGETTVEAAGGGDYTWVLGNMGESCVSACEATGHVCEVGDWGVNDPLTLMQKIQEARPELGELWEVTTELCTEVSAPGEGALLSSAMMPGISDGICQHREEGGVTGCGYAGTHQYQRLCRCIDG